MDTWVELTVDFKSLYQHICDIEMDDKFIQRRMLIVLFIASTTLPIASLVPLWDRHCQ